jgi:hypothetical protein
MMVKQLHDRKAAITTISDAGGTMGVGITGPEWLRELIGDDECFYDPQRVTLRPEGEQNSKSKVNDDTLRSVSDSLLQFKNLQVLDLRRSAITDASAGLMGQLFSLTHLRLSGTRISDKTIGTISSSLRNLQVLWVADTGVTDACINDLRQISTLTSLDVRGTQITPSAVETLREGLPNCAIKY